MTAFFTSDTHFYHNAILNFCRKTRRGNTPEEMTELLIEKWNSQVTSADHVYHLGDFSFGNKEQTLGIFSRLNGHIHIIRGNHDNVLDQCKNTPEFKSAVVEFTPYKEAKIEGQKVVMCHFPIIAWRDARYGSWMLFGHVHGRLCDADGSQFLGKLYDTGIDNRKDDTMALYSFDDLKKIMSTKEIYCYDGREPKER